MLRTAASPSSSQEIEFRAARTIESGVSITRWSAIGGRDLQRGAVEGCWISLYPKGHSPAAVDNLAIEGKRSLPHPLSSEFGTNAADGFSTIVRAQFRVVQQA